MIYGSRSLEAWAVFGLALGFANTGRLTLACDFCPEQRHLQSGDPNGRATLIELLQHIEQCPARLKAGAKPTVVEDGPVAMQIRDKGVYRLFTGAEVE